ncbi:MAG TPA: InlB B-repeat-containing protein, partial [Thermotogota bacterium]|nr:InlB B-repeat-containing protein [Thermotogota bacterium]
MKVKWFLVIGVACVILGLFALMGCFKNTGRLGVFLELLEPVSDEEETGLQPEFSWELEWTPRGERSGGFFRLYVARVGEEFDASVQTMEPRASWHEKLLPGAQYLWKVEAWIDGKLAVSSEHRAFSTQDFYTVEVFVGEVQGGQVCAEGTEWGESIVVEASVNVPTRLWARANPSYQFDGWYEGTECLGQANPFDYLPGQPAVSPRVAECDIQLEVRFSQLQYTVTTSASPLEAGDVRVNESEWGDQRCETVHSGEQVTLEALAVEGFCFDGWYEEGPGGTRSTKVSEDNPYEFRLQGDRDFWASFVPETYSITIVASPASLGNVRLNNGPWGARQQESVEIGDLVEVRALAKSEARFEGWFENGTTVSE